ncbi:carbonic anhydrase [Streptomyces agglomeratus]|uniref:Carbonic anhydrase n=1 Tax=Streptomyces agglomeratus TaxID=285458 RepID=A0A1E5PEZ5_9ACTN|nr:carbonic anhydrase [Streptomyces agglomeratus]OEJ28107.1 carbonic anhydrase [Streptomyces agglomeratus]OEJ37830.1 carbonic anhydrase [Streptomyces agglomeratus]OEJ47785.1 carbonic anhydrase [Streptomyces agglomeratus]OEJ50366.1 carbonic anhydrase [Streptomyces agglomeratus]OEJ57693.1 carbonic anhydrase [Streptomyces agglomeratus]
MQTFIDHARSLGERIAAQGERREWFGRLAAGQSPQALFITCSDSRVVPSLITGARPGELFELRTAGNAVPGYRTDRPSGEAATIEYAVSVLRVPDIVVCGHSHCGAVGARVRGEDLGAVPAVAGWLNSQLPDDLGGLHEDADTEVAAAAQRNVREQLERLRAYPCVAERLAAGQLRLHGWFYAVDTGLVLAHVPAADAFLPL